MAEELLEKIPADKCWTLTAKYLTTFLVLRGEKVIAPELGKDDGIIAPILGAEKWMEIHEKLRAETGRLMMPMVKETFNIPVKDAVEAAKLMKKYDVNPLKTKAGCVRCGGCSAINDAYIALQN